MIISRALAPTLRSDFSQFLTFCPNDQHFCHRATSATCTFANFTCVFLHPIFFDHRVITHGFGSSTINKCLQGLLELAGFRCAQQGPTSRVAESEFPPDKGGRCAGRGAPSGQNVFSLQSLQCAFDLFCVLDFVCGHVFCVFGFVAHVLVPGL